MKSKPAGLTQVSEEEAEPQRSADPFVDLFVEEPPVKGADGARGADGAPDAPGPAQPFAPWHARLPRLTRNEALLSSAINTLPHPFYTLAAKTFENTLAEYNRLPAEAVRVALEDWWEDDIRATALLLGQGRRTFTSFAVQPAAAHLTVEIRADFAAALINRMLAGDGAPPDTLRALSEVESAVIEFLCLSAARELNARLGGAVIQLESVAASPPPWLASSRASETGSGFEGAGRAWGLLATLRVDVGSLSGYARVYAGAEAFDALASALHGRKVDAAAPAGLRAWASRRLELFSRVSPEAELSLLVGEADVTFNELRLLEVGDVLIVERPQVSGSADDFHGELRVRVGDSGAVIVRGSAAGSGRRAGQHIKMTVESAVYSDELTEGGRVKMEETTGDKLFGDDAQALGGLLLTVRVEMAARRAKLEELAALRVGQILDLERRATDPVDLTVDGRRIARGELVEIEGRLGVRLTQVAAR